MPTPYSLHKYGSADAWWNLTKLQKATLREARLSGLYGGTPGRAPYFWAQSGLDMAAAEKAGIEPREFIPEAERLFDDYAVKVFDQVF